MFAFLKNQKGFSVIELTLAGMLAITATLAVSMGYAHTIGMQRDLSTRQDINEEMVTAMTDILRMGRIAQSCARVADVTTLEGILQCSVDMHKPPTIPVGDDTLLRMAIGTGETGNKELQWQKMDGTGNFIVFKRYPTINKFEICDYYRMSTHKCIIPTDNIGARYVMDVNATATPQNRFFRFQIIADAKSNAGVLSSERRVQSSFTVRHPTPNGIYYQWGQWNE